MKNKTNMALLFTLLMFSGVGLTSCDSNQSTNNTKEELVNDAIYPEGKAYPVEIEEAHSAPKYKAAQKKIQELDSVERAQRARAARTSGSAER